MRRETTFKETEYSDTDLMSEIKRIMLDGTTGQLVLNLKQGRLMSFTLREKFIKRHTPDNSVDTDSLLQATSHS